MVAVWQGDCLGLRVVIQPRASRDRCCGLHGDELKLQITAAPVDGEANQHLIHWLAKVFAVPKHRVQLISGQTSRHKFVQIDRPQQLPDWLNEFLEPR